MKIPTVCICDALRRNHGYLDDRVTRVESHVHGKVSRGELFSLAMALIPPLGALSDRIGRKPLLAASCVGFALLSYPLFLLMNQKSLLAAGLAHVALGALLAVFLSATIAALTELFPTRVRYGGFSIGYNISVAIFGGAAPLFATWLISVTGNPLSPAFYLIAAAVATFVTLLTITETARTPLRKT